MTTHLEGYVVQYAKRFIGNYDKIYNVKRNIIYSAEEVENLAEELI